MTEVPNARGFFASAAWAGISFEPADANDEGTRRVRNSPVTSVAIEYFGDSENGSYRVRYAVSDNRLDWHHLGVAAKLVKRKTTPIIGQVLGTRWANTQLKPFTQSKVQDFGVTEWLNGLDDLWCREPNIG